MKTIFIILSAYLIGSIPFSHIFPKLKGKDVKTAGTKNVGATNALVVAGPLMGALALAGDIAKGYLAIFLAQHYHLAPWAVLLAGFAAVAGHDFSLFLRFKGGKGVATTGGTFLAIDPVFGLLMILIWALCLAVFRYFIPSTMVALAFAPVLMWMGSMSWSYILYGVALFFLAAYAHRGDLKRFAAGQELTIAESMAKYLKK
ncbi:MAG: glycerol-3-phosphate 1-O-acyltransferase PlsY [Candidatus Margulisiibacteriota bacterium]